MRIAVQDFNEMAAELPRGADDLRRILGVEKAGRRLLLGAVMPLWLGAGLANWCSTGTRASSGPLGRGSRPCTP